MRRVPVKLALASMFALLIAVAPARCDSASFVSNRITVSGTRCGMSSIFTESTIYGRSQERVFGTAVADCFRVARSIGGLNQAKHDTPDHLFVPQRHDRVDSHRTPCRDVRGYRRDNRNDERQPHEHHRVRGPRVEHHGREQTRQSKRPSDSQDDSCRRPLQRAAHHEPENAVWLSSEGHSNPDLVGALRHGITHYAGYPEADVATMQIQMGRGGIEAWRSYADEQGTKPCARPNRFPRSCPIVAATACRIRWYS
jgi:hypothetical protein